MIQIDPRDDETLEIYLVRCLAESRRSRTLVCACYEGVVVLVNSKMTTKQVADASVEARINAQNKRR